MHRLLKFEGSSWTSLESFFLDKPAHIPTLTIVVWREGNSTCTDKHKNGMSVLVALQAAFPVSLVNPESKEKKYKNQVSATALSHYHTCLFWSRVVPLTLQCLKLGVTEKMQTLWKSS